MNPFDIKDCAVLLRMSGLPAAYNLRELRDRISSCSPDVLYHHFCETTLAPSFDYPDYRNDFAVWARHKLGDNILAERLAIIDPYSFAFMEDLRRLLLDILDERLSEVSMIPWVRPGHEFYFTEASTIVFDTDKKISDPDDLDAAILDMTTGSIYYHFLEARRRIPVGIDDFTNWLGDFGNGKTTAYIKALKQIDFTFYTLTELRVELARVLRCAKSLDAANENGNEPS
jgi:hypothetical protein